MKVNFGEIISLYITILFNNIHFKVTAAGTPFSQTLAPSTLPFTGDDTMHTFISNSVYQTLVTSMSTEVTKALFKTTPVSLKHTTMSQTIKKTSSNSPISSTFHLLSPSISHPTINTSSTSPTHKTPKSSQPLVHKVGLIVGIVLGLVLLSVCLIAFHKKETRIKCLKLMCRPCTKNYSSRYNIVPIYVYDDTEQDIRELQDDSDLPLV